MVRVIADVLAFSIGIGLLYLWSADFDRYSVLSVGRYRRVTSRETAGYDCLDCDEEAREERVAGREVVLFGVPVYTLDATTNTYCYDHASFEFRQGHARDPSDEPTTPTRDASPFGSPASVVAGFSAVLSLMAVLVVMIPALLIVSSFQDGMDELEEELES